jgi:transposase
MQGWICHATGWMCVCLIARAAPSRSPPHHRMPTGCAGWSARPLSTVRRCERRPGSMNGARLVHDQLELAGFKVAIADAQKVKGLAPLACTTDRIEAWVLPRALPPRPGPRDLAAHPRVRAERERARFRLHLGRPPDRAQQPHPGHPAGLRQAVSGQRPALAPAAERCWPAWHCPSRGFGNLTAALARIDDLDDQVHTCQQQLRRLGADHPDVPRLMTAPGIAWVLGSTSPPRWATSPGSHPPSRLCGYTGLCPGCTSPAGRDQRGPLATNGPPYLGWALIQAAIHAARHPCYRDHDQPTTQRLGRQRGARSPGWRLPASSPRPSGPCSPVSSRLLRQGPRPALWSPDDPRLNWASRSHLRDLLLPSRRRYRDEHHAPARKPLVRPLTTGPSS